MARKGRTNVIYKGTFISIQTLLSFYISLFTTSAGHDCVYKVDHREREKKVNHGYSFSIYLSTLFDNLIA